MQMKDITQTSNYLVDCPNIEGMRCLGQNTSIDALITYAVQQELIPRRPALSDVFVEIDP